MEVLGIEKYESEALNKLLEEFYATVRKKDREDNECDIFRVLIIAVDRYLYIYIYIYIWGRVYLGIKCSSAQCCGSRAEYI